MNLSLERMERAELEKLDIAILDKMAFGVVDGEIIELDPSQIKIQYPCDLDNPEALWKAQGMDWARGVDLGTPIEVSVDNDGVFQLEDGHHRWWAARETGRVLQVKVEIKGKPIDRILATRAQAQEAGQTLDLPVIAAAACWRSRPHKP